MMLPEELPHSSKENNESGYLHSSLLNSSECSTNRALNTESPKESSSVFDMVKVSTRKSERTRTSRMFCDVVPIKKSRLDATAGTHYLTPDVTFHVIAM